MRIAPVLRGSEPFLVHWNRNCAYICLCQGCPLRIFGSPGDAGSSRAGVVGRIDAPGR